MVTGGLPRCSLRCSANSRNIGESKANESGVGVHCGNSSPNTLRAAAHEPKAARIRLKTSSKSSLRDRACQCENVFTLYSYEQRHDVVLVLAIRHQRESGYST